jgi:hypothetical protein
MAALVRNFRTILIQQCIKTSETLSAIRDSNFDIRHEIVYETAFCTAGVADLTKLPAVAPVAGQGFKGDSSRFEKAVKGLRGKFFLRSAESGRCVAPRHKTTPAVCRLVQRIRQCGKSPCASARTDPAVRLRYADTGIRSQKKFPPEPRKAEEKTIMSLQSRLWRDRGSSS